MHELQFARVTAATPAEALVRLNEDLRRYGSMDDFATPLLWLEPESGQVTVVPELQATIDEPDAEGSPFADEVSDPAAWRDESYWARRAWEAGYAAVQVGAFFRPYDPEAIARCNALTRELQTLELDAFAHHFLALAMNEIRDSYARLSVTTPEHGRLESPRREALCAAFEMIYRELPYSTVELAEMAGFHQPQLARLPFLRCQPPSAWPAREVDGEGSPLYVLVDMHLRSF